ncbi:MAG: glycosyl hydrolase [Bacteroidia bacterium]|nr:glycosyl hydrolase [Bacteroidia bacterium]
MNLTFTSNIKKRGILWLCLLGILTTSTFYLYESQEKKKQREIYQQKLQPNEWQFRQRAYPSGEIDMQAYQKAQKFRKLKIAQKKLQTKDGIAENPWEFAGPFNIGGRITDLEMTASSPQRLYAAAASGGIFLSTDMGANWNPIFDDENSLSIGDMAIAPSNDSVIYVGTGEPNAGGGSLAYDGLGVYKSTDAGSSWTSRGLTEIGSVGRVQVHPDDPETVYVAAMGPLFKNSPDRGVYKSTNGGFSWTKVLYKNDSTGFIDFAIHPDNPDTLYAAAWERIRRPDRRDYGGASSGICRSYNGGASWEELNIGLPPYGGRIGIAISPSSPNILYAYFVNPDNGYLEGIYKTTDHGDNWTAMPIMGISDVPFMWWFGRIFVDPLNPDIVYTTALNMHKSVDGGNSWTEIFANAHVDQHAIAINPLNSNELFLGNDGGVYFSADQGATHTKINNLPITQFYALEIDESFPNRLYGGTQDNGTNRTLTGSLDDWENIFGGDGFYVLVDPNDNNFIYAEAQNGFFAKSSNGGTTFLSSSLGIVGTRKGWNSPFVFQPNNSRILYFGGSKLFKSTDRAENWTPISPDLTQGPGMGNLTVGVLTSLSVSSQNTQTIITGADDGTLSVTRDGGTNWSSVSDALPDRWITRVLADPSFSRGIYATFSGYRFGSNEGHVYKSLNLGSSWTDITGDLPDIPINDIIKTLPDNRLYIATDIGVYFSENDGTNWELLGLGLPNVVVTDLDYHEASNVLVAASYGRGLYRISLEEGIASSIEPSFQFLPLQAFPNPSTEISSLRLHLEKAGKFSLSIRDLQGALAKPIEELLLHAGRHEIELTLGKLAAGIYLIELTEEAQALRGTIKIMKH